MALLCLNRFLDVVEAVEEGRDQAMCFGPVNSVDLPEGIGVPTKLWSGEHQLEEVGPSTCKGSIIELHVQACKHAELVAWQ